jgi:hypothetical protein
MDSRTLMRWLEVGMVVLPLVLLVRRQCRQAGIGTLLPVIGLLIGLLLEMGR